MVSIIRRIRGKFKTLIWMIACVLLLALACVLLKAKMDDLMTQYLCEQVGQQSSLAAEVVDEKINAHLKELSNKAKQIEYDSKLGAELLKEWRGADSLSQYGLASLDGGVYSSDSFGSLSDYKCIKESFRGEQSACHGKSGALMLSVPVFHKRNVRYVLFQVFKKEKAEYFIDKDCSREKCYFALLDNRGIPMMEVSQGSWHGEGDWGKVSYDSIFRNLASELENAKRAVVDVKIGGGDYYFFMSPLKYFDFYLAGMVSEQVAAGAMRKISLLVSLMMIFFVSLFFLGHGVWSYGELKRGRRHQSEISKDPSERAASLLENAGKEMKNPVEEILGVDAVILNEFNDENLNEYGKRIRSLGRPLLSLANNILDLAKIESGNLEIVDEEYDSFKVLSESYVSVFSAKKLKNLDVSVESTIPAKLWGDENRVRQIICNIFSNAEKFMVDGTIVVNVGFECRANKYFLVIKVPNVGVGWTGIELVLVKRLVELMHGEFSENDRLENLPAFSIYLPQEHAQYNDEVIGNFEKRVKRFASMSENINKRLVISKARILVADEIPMNLRIVSGLLKESRVQLDAVNNGMEVIEKFKNHHYDIVFLDYKMPVVDGVNVLTIMQGLEDHPNTKTPVIMLANESSEIETKLESQMGYAAVLIKPFREDRLFELLKQFLPAEMIQYEDVSEAENAETKALATRMKMQMSASQELDAEKVKVPEVRPAPVADARLPEGLEFLSKTNVDVSIGLNCCENNEALYRKKLMELAKSDIDVTLTNYAKTEDFENYRLAVRSLKSMSLFIGAVELAGDAKFLENACNEGAYGYVRSRHDDLIIRCRELLRILKESLDGRAD